MIPTASLSPLLPAQTRSPAVQGGRATIDFAGSFAQAHTADSADRQKAAAPGNVLPTAPRAPAQAVEADPPVGIVEPAAIAAPVARMARPAAVAGLSRSPRAKDQSATDKTGTTEADSDQPDNTPARVDTPVDMPVVLLPAAVPSPIVAVPVVDTPKWDDGAAAPTALSPSLAALADATLPLPNGTAEPHTAGTPAAAGAPLAVADTRIPPAVMSDQMPTATAPAAALSLAGTAPAGWAATPTLPQPREAAVVPGSPDTPIGTPRWVSTGATTPVALAMTMPGAVQPQPGTVASASQVFGAAIRAATKPRDDRDAADPSMVSPTAGAPLSAPTIATAATQQAPLDMRQDRWPHAMIERIEILREAADAGDTRIRLVPDALGAIDVSLKQDGDTVHVHFHAEQGATRALLQEAQPRLAELAEARGLKLGQGGLGDSAGNGQPRAPATPQAPNRTPSHPAPATIVASPEDTRIA